MKVSGEYAEEHVAALAVAASQGEEVEIDVPGKPCLKLVTSVPAARPRHLRVDHDANLAEHGKAWLLPQRKKSAMLSTKSF